MKFFLLFMFITVALTAEESGNSLDKLAQSFTRIFGVNHNDGLECINKSGATIDDMKYLEDRVDVNDTETTNMKSLMKASCAVVCCAQKLGIMVGREIQLEEVSKFFQKSGVSDDVEIPLRNGVRTCKEQVADTSDICMAGYKFIKCVYRQSQMIAQH